LCAGYEYDRENEHSDDRTWQRQVHQPAKYFPRKLRSDQNCKSKGHAQYSYDVFQLWGDRPP
jgi:hypothetical protein